ncbi:hypothetical protein [Flavobacterium coralii]|uniref:hypothetical protein n=1 Tax=Flavobacterium coralii TaxID=2838017 RepID=UPI000C66518E|nr:hypothetical protein [Flavobacterium sp.]|tara:strand:- start:214 stop:459 length:246 start_codon:yes stop_codon:yes gene_type:complete
MIITEENLKEIGFFNFSSIDDFGIDEWRKNANDCMVTYYLKVCFSDLGLRNVYIHYPNGSVKEFKSVIEFDELIDLINLHT